MFFSPPTASVRHVPSASERTNTCVLFLGTVFIAARTASTSPCATAKLRVDPSGILGAILASTSAKTREPSNFSQPFKNSMAQTLWKGVGETAGLKNSMAQTLWKGVGETAGPSMAQTLWKGVGEAAGPSLWEKLLVPRSNNDGRRNLSARPTPSAIAAFGGPTV